MRIRTAGVSVATVLLLLSALAAPAQASEEKLISTDPSTGTPSGYAAIEVEKAYLEDLAQDQTPAEIDAILNSGENFVSLFDPETGETTAAYIEPESIFTQAITPRGPGCASTDACATTTTPSYYGWYGTGTLAVNVANTAKVYAGNKLTGFAFSSGSAIALPAGSTAVLVSASTLTKVGR